MGKRQKGLSIKSNVLREFYLKSGDQCTYPDCSRTMIDETGNFVGQICHIEVDGTLLEAQTAL